MFQQLSSQTDGLRDLSPHATTIMMYIHNMQYVDECRDIQINRHRWASRDCHDRDNLRLAPSENARKSQHRHTRADTSKCSAPQQNPSERVSNASTLATCPIFVKSTFALLLHLGSSLSLRHIGIHMYPSALRPSCLTFYD